MTFEMSGLGEIENVRVGGLGVKTLRVSHIGKIIYMSTRVTCWRNGSELGAKIFKESAE